MTRAEVTRSLIDEHGLGPIDAHEAVHQGTVDEVIEEQQSQQPVTQKELLTQ